MNAYPQSEIGLPESLIVDIISDVTSDENIVSFTLKKRKLHG